MRLRRSGSRRNEHAHPDRNGNATREVAAPRVDDQAFYRPAVKSCVGLRNTSRGIGGDTIDARMTSPAVVFDHVSFAFDDHVVLRDVSFVVPTGSMRIMLGTSGAGKSVVLKLILGLLRPDTGSIYVHGSRIDTMRERDLLRLRGDIGMLFQE